MLRITTLRPQDIPSAIKLTDQEKWGVTQRDLSRILRLDPKGSFIAKDGLRRIGLITTTTYGRELAWIGNVIVDRNRRGESVGHALVNNAVAYLQNQPITHIGLYCFHENVQFYRSLGFVTDTRFSRLRRKRRKFQRQRTAVNLGGDLTMRRLLLADKKSFGADRSKLILSILRSNSAWYSGLSNSPSSNSYLLVKVYKDMYEFGPWICIRPPRGQPSAMLQSVLAKTSGKPIEVSCLETHKEALRLLLKNGFEMVNHGYRMYLGKVPRLGDPSANYALGFLDKG